MPIQRPQPIVEQVAEILRQRIHDRVYPPGGRLPSESELASELGVSRATVRTALARFAGEGLILRKPGDGTYVNERIRNVDLHYGGLWDFSRLIEANGYRAKIWEISLEYRKPSPTEAQDLGIQLDARVLALDRLFLAGRRPAIYVRNAIPAEIVKNSPEEINSSLPIHKLLLQHCHETIAYAITDIRAAQVNAELADLLARELDSPILELREAFFNRANRPLATGLSYFDDSILQLRLVQAWG